VSSSVACLDACSFAAVLVLTAGTACSSLGAAVLDCTAAAASCCTHVLNSSWLLLAALLLLLQVLLTETQRSSMSLGVVSLTLSADARAGSCAPEEPKPLKGTLGVAIAVRPSWRSAAACWCCAGEASAGPLAAPDASAPAVLPEEQHTPPGLVGVWQVLLQCGSNSRVSQCFADGVWTQPRPGEAMGVVCSSTLQSDCLLLLCTKLLCLLAVLLRYTFSVSCRAGESWLMSAAKRRTMLLAGLLSSAALTSARSCDRGVFLQGVRGCSSVVC
jgi:hypothetical protein